MNFSDLMLTTPLGAIIIIVLLILAAIAAWGAYRDRPIRVISDETDFEEQPEQPIFRRVTGRKFPKREEKKTSIKEANAPPVVERAPCPCEDKEPCAKERAEIERLNTELGIAISGRESKEKEINDLTGRLSNANRNLEEAKKAKPVKPQNVAVGNILPLLNDLETINKNIVRELRNEAKKEQPNFERVQNQLDRFASYCEQRGYERPDPGQLLQIMQEALSK